MSATPARRVAHAVLGRTFEDGAYTDRAFTSEAGRAGLEGRERAFAMRLAYGAVQRRDTLDHVIGRLAGRPPHELDPPVLDALRLGVFQLCFLDGVAAHAAVSQSVELIGGPARGLVNAVLRRAAREAPALVAALPDTTPEEAALRHSHPAWVARLWWEAFGADAARSLMAADNEPAETAVRVNALVATPSEVAAELGAAPGGGRARGAGPRGPDRPRRLAGLRGGPRHAPVTRLDARGADAGPAARRARARPVRGAGRQGDAPRRPDGGRR